MTRRRTMLSGATVTALAASVLAGAGPAPAAEPVDTTAVVEAAQQAEQEAVNDWAGEDQDPLTAEAQAETGRLFFLDARRNEHTGAIMWAHQAGITTGWMVDGKPYYRPARAVNRDAMAAFLYRLAGSPDYTPPAVSPFRDVATTNMFYKEIAWLAHRGVAKGWDDGTFRPLAPVNRDATAAFLYRMADAPSYSPPVLSPFKDVVPGQEHYKEIAWLAAKGITTGWADGTFRPVQPVARDAMAAFLYRYAVPGWRPPVPTAFGEVAAARNDGFTFRPARLDGYDLGSSAVRGFSAGEQAVLDLDTAGAGYEKLETVFGIEDGHEDPESLYRVLVYYEDRVREIVDVRPGASVVYDDAVTDQDRVRFEVTKLAGTGTSTFVIGGARMLAGVDPDPQHPDRDRPPATWFLSHLDSAQHDGFQAGPESIDGQYYQSSLTVEPSADETHRISVPIHHGYFSFQAHVGPADRSEDRSAQYRVRVLLDDEVKDEFVAGAGPGHWVVLGPAKADGTAAEELHVEVTRVGGEGSSALVIGNPRLYAHTDPTVPAP